MDAHISAIFIRPAFNSIQASFQRRSCSEWRLSGSKRKEERRRTENQRIIAAVLHNMSLTTMAGLLMLRVGWPCITIEPLTRSGWFPPMPDDPEPTGGPGFEGNAPSSPRLVPSPSLPILEQWYIKIICVMRVFEDLYEFSLRKNVLFYRILWSMFHFSNSIEQKLDELLVSKGNKEKLAVRFELVIVGWIFFCFGFFTRDWWFSFYLMFEIRIVYNL